LSKGGALKGVSYSAKKGLSTFSAFGAHPKRIKIIEILIKIVLFITVKLNEYCGLEKIFFQKNLCIAKKPTNLKIINRYSYDIKHTTDKKEKEKAFHGFPLFFT
jgi:hypothetical protein